MSNRLLFAIHYILLSTESAVKVNIFFELSKSLFAEREFLFEASAAIIQNEVYIFRDKYFELI